MTEITCMLKVKVAYILIMLPPSPLPYRPLFFAVTVSLAGFKIEG